MPYKDPIRQKEAQREHYLAHKSKYEASGKDSKTKRREWVAAQKKAPCSDCGQRFPTCCMDFHHLGDKEVSVSFLIRTAGKERIEEEIAKCVLLCSNCHRIRHHGEQVMVTTSAPTRDRTAFDSLVPR